ncbi:hypothetical protein FACS189434_07130 [Bacteroidia bacterium]|nr:hypothetical protein FACS189434_07130 [Bacteroidia bacterium]
MNTLIKILVSCFFLSFASISFAQDDVNEQIKAQRAKNAELQRQIDEAKRKKAAEDEETAQQIIDATKRELKLAKDDNTKNSSCPSPIAVSSCLNKPSQYYQAKLAANGCGSANGIKIPDLIFKKACDIHDIGYGTLGKPKEVTDEQFLENMIKSCVSVFGKNKALLSNCVKDAKLYFWAVKTYGKEAYNDAQYNAQCLKIALQRENPNMSVAVQESNGTYYVSMTEKTLTN